MSRTVLDVDRDLLEAAKAILGLASLTATINEALRLVVAGQALGAALDDLAGLDPEYLLRAREAAR